MLKRAGETLNRIFRIAVLVLVSAQILTGMVWGFLNCGVLQNFPGTAELVELSGTLNLTGDTGIFYPALLIVVRALTVNGPLKFYHVMYLLQIVLAFASWFVFAGNVFSPFSRKKKAFFALALITNPYAMQVHLAVLEYSFISSFLALLVSFQIRFMREWKNPEETLGLERALRDVSVTSLFWLLAGLTRKEFIILGAIPVIALLITIVRRFAKTKAKVSHIAWPLIVALSFTGIICMTDSLFRDTERLSAADMIKRNLYYRVAWSENFRDRYHWPEYLTEFVDDGMMTHFMNDPGLVREEFTEYVTDIYGSKETSDKFYTWAKLSFAGNKKQIVKDTLSDIFGYIFAPFKTERALSGHGDGGFAAGNYDVMKQHDPKLTKVYLRYFSVLYIVFAVLLVLTEAFTNAKRYKKALTLILPALLIVLMCAVHYSFLGCSVFDHRKALFTTCLWMSLWGRFSLTHPKTQCHHGYL